MTLPRKPKIKQFLMPRKNFVSKKNVRCFGIRLEQKQVRQKTLIGLKLNLEHNN